MRKLKVLTLIDKPVAIGGAERLACEIAMGLDPAEFDRYLCSTREDAWPRLDAQLKAAGVEYMQLPRTRRFDLRAWASLGRFVQREEIDVIHTHLFGSNLAGSVIGRLVRVPAVVAHEHTWSYEGERMRRILDRNVVARFADRIIAVSEADRRKMEDVVGIPARKIIVIPNGIPPLAPAQADVRAELGIPADAPVIGAVVVLRPQKRVDRLVEATAELVGEFPDLRVLVVGDGYPEERAAVEARIRDLGVGDNVIMLGLRNDVPDVIRALDVGVLSSDFEGMPLSVIEYMAAGLPVVATAVGGVPELVRDGVTGTLVDELTPTALASALRPLLRDRDLARRLGDAGRAAQEGIYSLDAMIGRVAELYRELVDGSSRRSG